MKKIVLQVAKKSDTKIQNKIDINVIVGYSRLHIKGQIHQCSSTGVSSAQMR